MTPHHDAGAILTAEVERLREALRWYADEANWYAPPTYGWDGSRRPPGWNYPPPAVEDRGRRAREALGLIKTDASADD